MRKDVQGGFSLIELMVAMVVTLIVTGAIFGLLSGGQSAFKVQPEHTERQQNIRSAMDLMTRDLAATGVGLPGFIQPFTKNLNACAGCPDGGSPVGANADEFVTDEIEVLANTGGFDNERACHSAGEGNSSQLRLVRGTSQISSPLTVMLITTNGEWVMRTVVDQSTNNTGASNCESKTEHVALNFKTAGDGSGLNQPSGYCETPPPIGNITGKTCEIEYVSLAEVIRYRIRKDATGMPNLQRRSNGDPWAVVARGIDDLQIRYVTAGGAVTGTTNATTDGAPTVVNADFTTLITQVRITMSGRSAATGKIQGAMVTGTAPMAIRGSLTSQVSMRQALWTLTTDTTGTPVLWQ